MHNACKWCLEAAYSHLITINLRRVSFLLANLDFHELSTQVQVGVINSAGYRGSYKKKLNETNTALLFIISSSLFFIFFLL